MFLKCPTGDHPVLRIRSSGLPNKMPLLALLTIVVIGQDRKTQARVPISASDVAMMLESAGTDRVLAVDLHCGQIQVLRTIFFRSVPHALHSLQGFFHHTPVDNLTALRDIAPYLVREVVIPNFKDDPICIVSPDAGGVARAKLFMEASHSICSDQV